MSYEGQNVWIIGASSGIGMALAQELSQRGAHLIVSARRSDLLQNWAGQSPHTRRVLPFDAGDPDAVDLAAKQLFAAGQKIDRVIYMAAHYIPALVAVGKISDWQEIMRINVMGALYTTSAILPYLRRQSKSQIAFCASVAGYRGLPAGQPYSMSKAALINFAETLRLEESSHGIDVRVINPGFVATAMTQKNKFSMPMIITPQAAAVYIADGLCRSKFDISFPPLFSLAMKIMRLLPDSAFFAIARRLSTKSEEP